MAEISAVELYGLYIDTIERCTSDILTQSDEDIAYNLFEEFVIGATSFLHEDSLFKLRRAGFIDDEMVAVSKDVRKRWLVLERQCQTLDLARTLDEIRSKKEWRELFKL